ncbi:MAG: ribosome assembly RNA-binding protein YhbY [Ahniella sp.]|nr:ribosome assembly RNA-binding protein YhbY [Ahniella sp.]
MSLNSNQIRHLRGLAHHLKPVVMLGNDGLTDGVVAALEEALEQHELIKLKTAGEERADRNAAVAALIERTGAQLVQRIGHVAVLYRRAKEPKLDLPGMPAIVRQAERAAERQFERRSLPSAAERRAASPYGRAPAKGQAKGKPYAKAKTGERAPYGRTEGGAKRPTKVFGRAKVMSSRRGGNRPD